MERRKALESYQERQLSSRQLAGLFDSVASLVVQRGRRYASSELGAVSGYSQSAEFRYSPDPTLLKEVFYPDDDTIIINAEDSHISFLTPHIDDPDDVGNHTLTAVYINVYGDVRGVNIQTELVYDIMCKDFDARNSTFTGTAEQLCLENGRLTPNIQSVLARRGLDTLVAEEAHPLNGGDFAKIKNLLHMIKGA